MNVCLTTELLIEFVTGRVPRESALAISRHLEHCSFCQQAASDVSDDPEVLALQRSRRDNHSTVAGDPLGPLREQL